MKGFLYRLIMRIAHRYNWHYAPPVYPDGDTVLWCKWCGFRETVKWHKTYDLCKKSRIYYGLPYCGPTSNYMPAEYHTLEQAIEAQKLFAARNSIGWDIYDRETGSRVAELV